MKILISISNPLLPEVLAISSELSVSHSEIHTYVSQSDTKKLQITTFPDNRHLSFPLKVQSGQKVAYVSAFISDDKTVLGRLAIDELSDRL